jgi:hypothetical protein
VTDIRPGKKADTSSGGYEIKTKQNWDGVSFIDCQKE